MPILIPRSYPPEAVAPPRSPLVGASRRRYDRLHAYRWWRQAARYDIEREGLAYADGFRTAYRIFGNAHR